MNHRNHSVRDGYSKNVHRQAKKKERETDINYTYSAKLHHYEELICRAVETGTTVLPRLHFTN